MVMRPHVIRTHPQAEATSGLFHGRGAGDGGGSDRGGGGALLRLYPEYSLTWITENQPLTREIAEGLREVLRKAGVPEA